MNDGRSNGGGGGAAGYRALDIPGGAAGGGARDVPGGMDGVAAFGRNGGGGPSPLGAGGGGDSGLSAKGSGGGAAPEASRHIQSMAYDSLPHRYTVDRILGVQRQPRRTIGRVHVAPMKVELLDVWLEDVSRGNPELGQCVVLQVIVADRDTGEPRELRFMSERIEPNANEGRIADVVRASLIAMLTHEVDEALHVGGVRVFDPHRPFRPMSVGYTVKEEGK